MLLHAKQFEMYADIFEKLQTYNEAEDFAKEKYQNSDAVIDLLKKQGINVKK
jgi:hypothetical protein